MANKLDFKKWLDMVNEIEGSEFSLYDCNPILAERYANYKTREIFGLLFEFRNKILLNGGISDFSILRKFDEHFKIEKV